MAATAAQKVLVTGGAAGIGAAIVRGFRAKGFAVVFCDRDEATGSALAHDVQATFVAMDVTDEAAIDALFVLHGPFSVLVNNVGADQHAFFTQTTKDDWRRLLAINLETTFAFSLKALPAMQAAGYGRIVNIASEAGRLGSKGGSVYAAAKAGAAGLTRSIALENGRHGITANNIALGTMRTPLTEPLWAEMADSPQAKAILSRYPIRRPGLPEDVTHLAVLLAGDHGSWITGQTIPVNGGYSFAL